MRGKSPTSSRMKIAGAIIKYLKFLSENTERRFDSAGGEFMSMCARSGGQQAAVLPFNSVRSWIGAGLGGPSLIHFLLLVDADLFGDCIELRCHASEDSLRILAGPQTANRPGHRLVIFVLLKK